MNEAARGGPHETGVGQYEGRFQLEKRMLVFGNVDKLFHKTKKSRSQSRHFETRSC